MCKDVHVQGRACARVCNVGGVCCVQESMVAVLKGEQKNAAHIH